MRKPINKWAVFMWVVATSYLLQAVTAYFVARKYGMFEMQPTPPVLEQLFASIVRPTFFSAPMLIGIGVLIELADQIRWDALSDEARGELRKSRALLARIRAWPN